MNLLDLVNQTDALAPWSEGEKIPWNDPALSERMLKEHLSQEHDAASRRFEKIDAHVDWIHNTLLSGQSTRILDLGCGPGLYSNRLAKLGHECVEIDFSPASIAYAMKTAEREYFQCMYMHEDIRTIEYGSGFDLAMLIFGEFNAFRPADAKTILQKSFDALDDEGIILLEVSTFESLARKGKSGASWYSSSSGLFSDQPHLCLTESFWDVDRCVATTRFFILDATTGDVTRHAISIQGYTDQEYRSLLAECGFTGVEFLPSLTGTVDETQKDLFAIVARKQS